MILGFTAVQNLLFLVHFRDMEDLDTQEVAEVIYLLDDIVWEVGDLVGYSGVPTVHSIFRAVVPVIVLIIYVSVEWDHPHEANPPPRYVQATALRGGIFLPMILFYITAVGFLPLTPMTKQSNSGMAGFRPIFICSSLQLYLDFLWLWGRLWVFMETQGMSWVSSRPWLSLDLLTFQMFRSFLTSCLERGKLWAH